jgi:hypothetical protein
MGVSKKMTDILNSCLNAVFINKFLLSVMFFSLKQILKRPVVIVFSLFPSFFLFCRLVKQR